jgi:Putative methyltransferase
MSQYIPVRVKIKLILKRFLPQSLFKIISQLWINTFAKCFKVQDVLEKYTALFISKYPKVVQAGPFTGLNYVDKAVGSNYLHKLVGSYEAVLHPFINSLSQKRFDTIIDIGAAEGYYLIGLGRKFPEAKLVGFELEETGRNLITEMYTKNNLTNEIILEGEATVNNTAPYITENTLLICDCEGGELDILNPLLQSNFKKIDTAIIELHDFIKPGIKEALTERFSPTHKITLVPFKMADVTKFPFLASISNQTEQYEILRERGWQEQEWMLLERK